jgi:hypothetical protein
MTPEQKLQGLLRLKAHEKPPADYFENFLEEFHQRQRESIMKQGVFSLFWERLTTWADGMRRPVVIWGAAGAYASVLLLVCLWPKPGPSPTSGAFVLQQPTVPSVRPSPAPPLPRTVVPVSNNPTEALEPSGNKQKSSVLPAEPAPALEPEPKTRDL